MRPVKAKHVGAALIFLFAMSAGTSIVLSDFNGNLSPETLSFVAAFTSFTVVGALIVARRAENSIGWIYCGVGLLAGTGILAQEYAEYSYVTSPGALPGAIVAAWYAAWYWFPLLGMAMVFPLLLFPTGRPLSPRWKPVVWIAGASMVATTVLASMNPVLELQNEDFLVPNPMGVSWIGNVEESALGAVLFAAILLSIVVAFVSLMVRFRRSKGTERQQLKWFTYGGALVLLLPMGDFIPAVDWVFGDFLFGIVIGFPAITAGIAILRYRLYDIDRIINRTLVYGALTAVLSALYGLSVIGVPALVGQSGESSQWVVAASTLLVAALFQPLRRRIQGFIDRRFYRSRYDAIRTAEAFGNRLRDEVTLDTVSNDLIAVVRGTLRPAHTSLWLRTGGER